MCIQRVDSASARICNSGPSVVEIRPQDHKRDPRNSANDRRQYLKALPRPSATAPAQCLVRIRHFLPDSRGTSGLRPPTGTIPAPGAEGPLAPNKDEILNHGCTEVPVT